MLSSASSSSSSFFSAIPSLSFRQDPHGGEEEEEEDTPMESSSSSSLKPCSGTIKSKEDDIRRMSSASASSSHSCSSSQPSFSNPSPSNTHLVFISFRGPDTRRGFVSYLQKALESSGIGSYQDNRDLERGNEISSTLLRAIEKSKISIIVFSKNYASSSWTMNELVKIMDCQETRGQVVLPIFYEITPSEVRRKRISPTGFLFRSSSMHETEQRWAAAMKKAAGLAGWDSSHYRTESELVEVIVNEVKKQLEFMSQHGSDQRVSSPNRSPEEPNSGGLSSSSSPTPVDLSPKKCLSNGTLLNLRGYFLWRKEHEKLILQNRRPDPPLNLDTSRTIVHRNRYLQKQEQRWWAIQQEHQQQ